LAANLAVLAAVQLLPALESGEETLVGGQAVLEGVMMRSPHAWALPCASRQAKLSPTANRWSALPNSISGWAGLWYAAS